MDFDKRTLHRMLGALLIAVALFSLLTGKVIRPGAPRRTYVGRSPRFVSRAEDPGMFWIEVATLAGLGAFALYHASRTEP
jgi:hypothetical protein